MTKQEQLTALIKQRADLIARNAYLDNQVQLEQTSYEDWAAINEWEEAERHKLAAQNMRAEIQGNTSLIAGLTVQIDSLDAQIKAEIAAANANTNLTNSTANLTPAQLAQIKLAEIEAQKAGSLEKIKQAAKDAEAAIKANYAANQSKYYIVAALVVIIALAFILKKNS